MPGRSQVSTTEISPAEAATPAPPSSDGRSADGGSRAKAKPPVARTAKVVKGGRTTHVVLRRLDPWSVLKLSFVYYLAVFVVIVVAAVLLWAGASAIGVIGNIESFMVDIGFEDFTFIPSKLLGGVALGGLVLVVAGTFANVLLSALFNLMSDVVGGLKLTLQEDGVAAPPVKEDGRSTV